MNDKDSACGRIAPLADLGGQGMRASMLWADLLM